jgi:hypothetical protein
MTLCSAFVLPRHRRALPAAGGFYERVFGPVTPSPYVPRRAGCRPRRRSRRGGWTTWRGSSRRWVRLQAPGLRVTIGRLASDSHPCVGPGGPTGALAGGPPRARVHLTRAPPTTATTAPTPPQSHRSRGRARARARAPGESSRVECRVEAGAGGVGWGLSVGEWTGLGRRPWRGWWRGSRPSWRS